jgi:hypothetical protein
MGFQMELLLNASKTLLDPVRIFPALNGRSVPTCSLFRASDTDQRSIGYSLDHGAQATGCAQVGK